MATLASRAISPEQEKVASSGTGSLIDDLDPTYREIFLTALVAIWFAFGIGVPAGSEDLISTIGLVAFSAVLGWAGYRMIARNISTMWTPLAWYRIAMMSYFGVGSLVPIYTNDDTRSMMESFYIYYASDILKLNLLMTISQVIFLGTAKIIFMVIRNRRILERPNVGKRSFISTSNFGMMTFGSICLAVGSAVNYLIVLPQVVGWVNFTFFSTLYNLAALSWLGYFMVTLWALDNNRRTIVLIVISIALGESVIGFLAMSKSVIMMPLVMIGLSFIYHKRTLPRLLAFAGIMISLFMYLSPMMTYARQTGQAYYNASPTPADVGHIYASYLTGDREIDAYSEVQSGWARLSYVNAGTFAIAQWDRGLPGDSYRYWSIVLIPRIIYPNKPFITDVSREFSYAANGNYDSSSSPGMAPEAYWNGGWPMMIGITMILSAVFTLWSIYSFVVIQRSAWHLFFVVLLGMRTGLRVDGAFVADVIGPIGIAVLAHIVLELLNRFLPQGWIRLLERQFKLE